jgi:hypothetical protein
MKNIIFLLFSILYLCSCSSSSDNKIISLATDYTSLAPKVDTFIIDNKTVQILGVKTDASILIPTNSLTYEDGSNIDEPIQVTFQLFNDKADMLLSNLTTLSDGQPLVSTGMFHINATVSSGKKLKIQSPWRVEIADGAHSDAKIFEGNIEDGNINWEHPREKDNKIIPIPFEILKDYYTGVELYAGEVLFANPDLDIALYQNTWIASRELWNGDGINELAVGNIWETYFPFFHYASYYYYDYEKSHKQDQAIQLSGSTAIESKSYKYHLLHLFTENIDKPLYKMSARIDQKIQQELDLIQLQGYIIDHCCETKYPKFSSIYDQTIENLKKHLSLNKDSLYKSDRFEWKKSTVVDERFLLEVDSNYLRTLRKKYLDSLTLAKQQYQDSITTTIANQYQKLRDINNFIAAEITTFGWHNVDYFYKITEEKVAKKLLVKTDQPAKQILLAYKRQNIIIPLHSYSTTFELKNVKLPIDDVLILAIGWDKNGNIVLGHQELKLQEENDITLKMNKKTDVNEVKEIIQSLL